MGHYRGDLVAEPLRFWRVREYLIIYRSEKRPLEIVRVLHAKRDVRALPGMNFNGLSIPAFRSRIEGSWRGRQDRLRRSPASRKTSRQSF
jgi:hypothetical protein